MYLTYRRFASIIQVRLHHSTPSAYSGSFLPCRELVGYRLKSKSHFVNGDDFMSRSNSRQRTKNILVRLHPDEKLELTERADGFGVSNAEYVRSAGLNITVSNKVSPATVAALSEIISRMAETGQQLKSWLDGAKGSAKIDTDEILKNAMKLIGEQKPIIELLSVKATAGKQAEKITGLDEKQQVRMTPIEEKTLKEKAAIFGLDLPAYLRAATLDRPLYPKAERDAIAMLALAIADMGRLGGLLKWWLTGEVKSPGGQLKAIMDLLDELSEGKKKAKRAMLMLTGRKIKA